MTTTPVLRSTSTPDQRFGAHVAVEGIDLRVDAGECFAFSAPTARERRRRPAAGHPAARAGGECARPRLDVRLRADGRAPAAG